MAKCLNSRHTLKAKIDAGERLTQDDQDTLRSLVEWVSLGTFNNMPEFFRNIFKRAATEATAPPEVLGEQLLERSTTQDRASNPEQERERALKTMVEMIAPRGQDRNTLAWRVMEHSTDDGLELARRLGFSAREIFAGISQDTFVRKHREFTGEIFNIVVSHRHILTTLEHRNLVRDFERTYISKHSTLIASDETAPIIRSTFPRKSPFQSGEAKVVAQAVDQYYAQYLRTKELKDKWSRTPEEIKEKRPSQWAWIDSRSTGERLADDYFKNVPGKEPRYVTSTFRSFLVIMINKLKHKNIEDTDSGLFEYCDQNGIDIGKVSRLVADSAIEASDALELIKTVVRDFRLSMHFQRHNHQFAWLEYHPENMMIHGMRQKFAQEELKKELLEMIQSHGSLMSQARLEFDPKERRWGAFVETQDPRQELFDLHSFQREELLNDTPPDLQCVDLENGTVALVYREDIHLSDGRTEQTEWVRFGTVHAGGHPIDHRTIDQSSMKVANRILYYAEKETNNNVWTIMSGGEHHSDILYHGPVEPIDIVPLTDSKKIGVVARNAENPNHYNFVVYDCATSNKLSEQSLGDAHNVVEVGSHGQIAYIQYEGANQHVVYPDGKTSAPFQNIFRLKVFGETVVALVQDDTSKQMLLYPDGHLDAFGLDSIEDFVMTVDGSVSAVLRTPIEHKLISWQRTPNTMDPGVAQEMRLREPAGSYCVILFIDKRPYVFFQQAIGFEDKNSNIGKEIFDDHGNCVARLPFDSVYSLTADDHHITIVGNQKGRIVKYHKPIGKQPIDLTFSERQKLELLNLVANPEPDKIERRYRGMLEDFKKQNPDFSLEEDFTRDPKKVLRLQEVLQQSPEIFLELNPAKRDSLDPSAIRRFLEKVFPELTPPEPNAWAKFTHWLSKQFETPALRPPAPAAEGLLQPHTDATSEGGDPRQETGDTVVEFRDPLHEFIPIGIFLEHDATNGAWRSVGFPVQPHLGDPVKLMTATLPNIKGLHEANLPFVLGSRIVPERIKAILGDGSEVLCESIQNLMGQTTVTIPEGATKIVYSFERSELPQNFRDVGSREYEQFKATFIRKNTGVAAELLKGLPDEIQLFLKQLGEHDPHLSPKEKIYRIQKFARDVMYYDMANADVMVEKQETPFGRRMEIMRERLRNLKQQNPNHPGYAGKMFAGVCADADVLTVAMLRKAGFLSGYMTGLMANGTVVSSDKYHANAFVIWPSADGEGTVIIPVDGTPGGDSPEAKEHIEDIQQPTLEEAEKKAEEQIEQLIQEADQKLDEIKVAAQNSDLQKIREMSNGELERLLNIVLSYEVKSRHVRMITHLLNFTRYAGIEMGGNLDERQRFQHAVKRELEKERGFLERTGADSELTGTQLLHTIEEFIKRYRRGVNTHDSACDSLDAAIDAAKDFLDPVEAKAATVVIAYLRARRMVRV